MHLLLRSVALVTILVPVAQAKAQQARTQPQRPLTLAQVWKLDAVYKDSEHGVTFRYPSVWKADTQLAYVPPALSIPSDTKPIAGFAYELDGFPRARTAAPYSGTNLEGFGIVYSVIAAQSSATCKAYAASLSETGETHSALLADRSFWVYETFNFGMMQSTSGKLYATYSNHICYLFETDVAAASAEELENIRQLTPAQSNYIDIQLLKIMKSVRIATR